MFAVLHSDINLPKSGLLHLTGQPYCKKSRSAKVKDGIINLILRNYFVDRSRAFPFYQQFLSTCLLGCESVFCLFVHHAALVTSQTH